MKRTGFNDYMNMYKRADWRNRPWNQLSPQQQAVIIRDYNKEKGIRDDMEYAKAQELMDTWDHDTLPPGAVKPTNANRRIKYLERAHNLRLQAISDTDSRISYLTDSLNYMHDNFYNH